MATVGNHSLNPFPSPVRGSEVDANVVRGNDNRIQEKHNAHDSDATIHVQSSTLANRPAAGVAGRVWVTEDSGSYQVWYDDGSTWQSVGGGSSSIGLNDLTDVTITSPSTGEVLTYNGSIWVNSANNADTATKLSSSRTFALTGDVTGSVSSDLTSGASIATTISELPVSKLQDGTARQLLQTDAAGTGVEWTSNVDIPGTLDVTGAATFDSGLTGTLTGNASTATALSSARTFALTGDITGSVSSDLTSGASIATSIGSGVIVDADINASAEIAVSKLANGTARQLLQTDAAGTDVEWASNIDVPGTLDVSGAVTLDSTISLGGVTYTFPASDGTSGQFLSTDGAGTLSWSTGGGGGSSSMADGTESAPGWYFTSDTNTGFYRPASDVLGISTGGAAAVSFDASQNATFSQDVRFFDADKSNYVGFQSASTVASNVVWTLPDGDGPFDGAKLMTDGAGTLYWEQLPVADRGLVAGGFSTTTLANIDYFSIDTASSVASFGSLSVARYSLGSASNNSRALFFSGQASSVIDYVSPPTAGNATSFGNTSSSTAGTIAAANDTRAVINQATSLQYVTIATPGNSASFGTSLNHTYGAAFADSSRAVFAGGSSSSSVEYVTIATTGNAVNGGSLFVSVGITAGCADATRGLIGGGSAGGYSNVIQYTTIQTLGSVFDFGDLTVARGYLGACASETRAVFSGGFTGAASSTMDYVTIQTLSNATNFGSLPRATYVHTSTSGYSS